MERPFIVALCLLILMLMLTGATAQTTNPGAYCAGSFSGGNCIQGGAANSPNNQVNDFIDSFSTTGGLTNITNNSSGCSIINNPNIYTNFFCKHYLEVLPSQTITCNMRSGTTYGQGFAVFIDWNQDNVFQVPAERVAATANVPPAASNVVLTFSVPAGQPNGTYRLRVRCAFNVAGNSMTPCGSYLHGETEDYGLFIGPIPVNSGIITATVSGKSPICAGQALNFSVTSTPSAGVTYTWTGPAGFSSVAATPSIPNASATASGVYTMNIGGACPVTKTIAATVIAYPQYTLSQNKSLICQYDSVRAIVSYSPGTNSSPYSYTWTTSPGAAIFPNNSATTSIKPQNSVLKQYGLSYSVTVSHTLLSCPIRQAMTFTVNNPSSPTLSMPPPLCNTAPALLLKASPGGGTWTPGAAVSAGGSFSPGLAQIGTNTVTYSITAASCIVSSTGTLSVSQFNDPALSTSPVTLCSNDPGLALMSLVQTTVGGTWYGKAVSNNTFLTLGLPSGTYNLTYSTQSTPVASVCPAFSVYPFTVYNPPMPAIFAIKPTCNTGPTVSLSTSLPGGKWSGTGVSVSGTQFPFFNTIGTNTVTYAVGQGTCLATATRTFHVSQFNTAALTKTFVSVCAFQNNLNLMSFAQNTVAGSWNGPHVTGANLFNAPSTLPSFTYVLTYINKSTPDPLLCPDTNRLKVSVYNPPVPTITQPGPLCSNHTALQLSVTPNTGTWTASSFLNTKGILSPSLCAPGYNKVVYANGTGTCIVQQTMLVNVEFFVPANITGNIGDQCTSNPGFDLTSISLSRSGSWKGKGITGSFFHPKDAGAGSFVLKHSTASSPGGFCRDEDSLTVKVFSMPQPILNKVGPFCSQALPRQLIASPVGGVFFGGNGACDINGVFQPALGQPGDNIVNYSVTAGPCIAYAQTTITVERFVTADFAKQVFPYCRTSPPVNMNSFVQNPDGDWSGPGISGNMFDPSKASIGTTNVIVYKTYSIPTGTLCPDTSSVRITVKDIPDITARANLNRGCAPFEVLFNTPNANTGKGTWHFNDGSQLVNGLTSSHIFSVTGVYHVVFRYDEGTCPAQNAAPLTITVDETPVADFTFPETIFTSDPDIQLVNTSSPVYNNRFTWNIAELYTSKDISPVVKLEKAGKYPVTLSLENVQGCRNSVTKLIEVKSDLDLYIPNAFTPNLDGLNDLFIPVFTGRSSEIRFYEMEIFDRWGHAVFHSGELSKGWDGSSAREPGSEIKEGVYTFRIRFTDPNGQLNTRTGHITLLK